MEELKYPVGKFQVPTSYDDAFKKNAIENFKLLPVQLKELCSNLSDEQLVGRYRPEGWSVKQVIHHLADSHMNAFIRIKLAVTEENPIIKPYLEKVWAEMPDANNNDIASSILILQGVHNRLVTLFQNLKAEEWDCKVFHPESKREMSVNFLMALYSWHCNHHLGHIKNAISNPY